LRSRPGTSAGGTEERIPDSMSFTDIVPSPSSVSRNLAPRTSPYFIWLACFTAAG